MCCNRIAMPTVERRQCSFPVNCLDKTLTAWRIFSIGKKRIVHIFLKRVTLISSTRKIFRKTNCFRFIVECSILYSNLYSAAHTYRMAGSSIRHNGEFLRWIEFDICVNHWESNHWCWPCCGITILSYQLKEELMNLTTESISSLWERINIFIRSPNELNDIN